MEDINRFKNYLQQRGMLMTQERLAIAEIVCSIDRVFDVEMLRASLDHTNYPVSVATIYRNVKLLTKAGIIENLEWDCSGKSSFRKLEFKPVLCTIKCTDCSCEHTVSNDELEKAVLQLCKEFNIEQTGVVINIKGRRKCNCKHNKKRR